MKKWICLFLTLLLLGCSALAENSLDGNSSAGGAYQGYTDYDDYGDGEYLEISGALLDSVGVRIGIAAVAALIIAFVRVNSMKAKLQTAHSRSGAADYAKDGSFELGIKQDRFLYERTERRRIQTSQPSAQGANRGPGGGNTRGGGGNRIR